MIITFLFMGISWAVSNTLQRRFKEYSQMPINLTGAQIAEKMLNQNGVYDVKVVSVPGALTDHYNPATKTVNLSDWVYAQSNVAAAAVAAHECGHAVQHNEAYTWLTMRSKLVPVVSISARYTQWILMGGLILWPIMKNPIVFIIGIVFFALSTAFSFVTLPVEFDASRRALAWLDSSNILVGVEHEKAKNALWWAAMTYVVAALASLGQLLYYIMLLMRRRD
ncbi:MAG: zinc metallopeptidase [Bacteroidetes bacterium]|nr:zinc metallopeptidase [Bacteroidota bacterium]MBP7255788.1 zinc metallopeptidase [Chitinophagales bacterium]MBK7138222.1 zinc metallopeptidase [Bacteroidota bacterium]MBK7641173.1 zinc metallopeptidase [Bacteroidota bacterium]MBK8673701.1 zinc metallopeptidase [Bacteroidota bacterium]